MPTLSVVKYDFLKIGKWGGIIIGVIIILFLAFKFLLFVKEIIFPTPPPPPTVNFGKLPIVNFPEGLNKSFTYEIDTLSGELPIFPISEKVYKMEQRGRDILAVEKINQKVAGFGFNNRPQQISDFTYKWINPSPPDQKLTFNIKLNEFNLNSSYLNYKEMLQSNNFQNKTQPINTASSFINGVGMNLTDIDQEKTKIYFSNITANDNIPVEKATDSNIATVYFFQKDIDKLPIVYPQGINSSMKIITGAGKLMGIVLEASFSHQNVLDESATYPIKTAQEAYDDLRSGKAYIASHVGDDTKILIKEIYPALFYEGKLQEYMIPVIVFEGNNDFVAYVPAVRDEWLNK